MPRRSLLLLALLQWVLVAPSSQAQQAILRYESLQHPVVGTAGMVVSQRAAASAVGADVLGRGGNAVDAAVATAFALAVALPRAGNLGGGGFLLRRDAATGATQALDFRERAPAAASADMFIDASGEVDQTAYRRSHLAVGVPGTVAGLASAWERFGSLPWPDLLAPAIAMATDGVEVGFDLAAALQSRRTLLRRHPYTATLFFKPDGSDYQPGDLLRQPDLAKTLRRIARQGPAGFYSGEVADLLVKEMRAGGGLITAADLAAYEVTYRKPITGTYLGHEIVSMPPPSSGGVHLVQMLNMLERFPLAEYGAGSARALHLIAEAMKRAYADRSVHMGDPEFHDVPVDWLTSKSYAAQLAASIPERRATPAAAIAAGEPLAVESEDTTHLSVIDADGTAVSLTYTLNFSFGGGIAVPGAGFLLNNEMADFSARPGVPDAFGLVTGTANAIAPGKRPLSAMTPTIVVRDKRPVLVTGSPGGSRIITAVLQHILGVIAFEQNVAAAVHTPRIHHQWQPDRLQYEPGIGADALELLRAWGHPLETSASMGSVQAIAYDGERFYGAADPRRPGAAAIAAPTAKVPQGEAR